MHKWQEICLKQGFIAVLYRYIVINDKGIMWPKNVLKVLKFHVMCSFIISIISILFQPLLSLFVCMHKMHTMILSLYAVHVLRIIFIRAFAASLIHVEYLNDILLWFARFIIQFIPYLFASLHCLEGLLWYINIMKLSAHVVHHFSWIFFTRALGS